MRGVACIIFAVINLLLQSYLSKHFGFYIILNLFYSLLRGKNFLLGRKAIIMDIVFFDLVIIVTVIYRIKGIVSLRYTAYFSPLSLLVLSSTLLLQRAHV